MANFLSTEMSVVSSIIREKCLPLMPAKILSLKTCSITFVISFVHLVIQYAT